MSGQPQQLGTLWGFSAVRHREQIDQKNLKRLRFYLFLQIHSKYILVCGEWAGRLMQSGPGDQWGWNQHHAGWRFRIWLPLMEHLWGAVTQITKKKETGLTGTHCGWIVDRLPNVCHLTGTKPTISSLYMLSIWAHLLCSHTAHHCVLTSLGLPYYLYCLSDTEQKQIWPP